MKEAARGADQAAAKVLQFCAAIVAVDPIAVGIFSYRLFCLQLCFGGGAGDRPRGRQAFECRGFEHGESP